MKHFLLIEINFQASTARCLHFRPTRAEIFRTKTGSPVYLLFVCTPN